MSHLLPPAAAIPPASILIVDDMPDKHLVFRSILADLGEPIVSARSGREALARVLDQEFAVILLDVNMPDIDGLETASLIRHHRRSARTPILFITAYVDDLQARRGYALGAVDYIPSPVVPEVLRSKVRVFVELHRMNRQLQLRAAEREALAREQAARAAAEQAVARADYLAQASQELSRSLDLQQTREALLRVAVPHLAEQAALVEAADGEEGDRQDQQREEAGAGAELGHQRPAMERREGRQGFGETALRRGVLFVAARSFVETHQAVGLPRKSASAGLTAIL